jgi:GDPmannose 4,6-dehydratase
MKHALITGVNGQDGSYLAEFLLKKGYKVFGTIRRNSTPNLQNIEHIKDKISLIYADLTDTGSITSAIKQAEPDELYNLAAQSFVSTSFIQPLQTGEVTGLGVMSVLEAIRQTDPKIKFYQASSSEMYGKVEEIPQTEKTSFHPRSPYGVAKVYGFWATINYREGYYIFACNGILFNHESPRRGLEFVTRKISHGVAKIYLGKEKKLALGNLAAKRDWGYTGDYVKAMWLMMQQEKPQDFVIATGKNHSVEEFVSEAFKCVGIKNWKKYVTIDKKLFRPAEVDELRGDYSKAKKILGWEPEVSFKELVKMMVEADVKRIKNRI